MNKNDTFPIKTLYGKRCSHYNGDLFLPKLSKNGIILKDGKRLCPHCNNSLKIKINNIWLYYFSVFLMGVMPIVSITGAIVLLSRMEPLLSKPNETAIIFFSLFSGFLFMFLTAVFLAKKNIIVYEKDNSN